MLWPVRIPSHAFRIKDRASHIPGQHWRLLTTVHWRLFRMLPRRHTDLLDQREGARGSRNKGTRRTTPIRPLLQRREVPLRSLGDRLPRIYHQLWRNRHGIRPHINHRRLVYAQVNPRSSTASRLHQLLPTIHLLIRQSNGTNFRLTKEIDKQMGMDPKGRARIPEAQEGI